VEGDRSKRRVRSSGDPCVWIVNTHGGGGEGKKEKKTEGGDPRTPLEKGKKGRKY